jgi:hypothetical protein
MGAGAFSLLKRHGSLAKWLILTAFCLRALIPVGFMPAFSAGSVSSFKVVICSAGGAHTVDFDLGGSDPAPGTDTKSDSPCAFAGLGTASIGAVAIASIEAPAFEARTIGRQLPDYAVPPARAGPAVGSRAPPILA